VRLSFSKNLPQWQIKKNHKQKSETKGERNMQDHLFKHPYEVIDIQRDAALAAEKKLTKYIHISKTLKASPATAETEKTYAEAYSAVAADHFIHSIAEHGFDAEIEDFFSVERAIKYREGIRKYIGECYEVDPETDCMVFSERAKQFFTQFAQNA
jgi:hypothetical protein